MAIPALFTNKSTGPIDSIASVVLFQSSRSTVIVWMPAASNLKDCKWWADLDKAKTIAPFSDNLLAMARPIPVAFHRDMTTNFPWVTISNFDFTLTGSSDKGTFPCERNLHFLTKWVKNILLNLDAWKTRQGWLWPEVNTCWWILIWIRWPADTDR